MSTPLHEVVWTLDRDTTKVAVVCNAPAGDSCRMTCRTCNDEGRETVCVYAKEDGHVWQPYGECREAEFVNETYGPDVSEAFSGVSRPVEVGRLTVDLTWTGDDYRLDVQP